MWPDSGDVWSPPTTDNSSFSRRSASLRQTRWRREGRERGREGGREVQDGGGEGGREVGIYKVEEGREGGRVAYRGGCTGIPPPPPA